MNTIMDLLNLLERSTSMARDFKGIWIPKEIWLAPDLTVMEKLFLVEINSLDNADGCWANNRYFADFFEISQSRVSEIINSLVSKGLINSEINESSGNRRVLRFSEGGLRKTLRGSSENASTSSEKAKHSNTSNNTFNNTLSKWMLPDVDGDELVFPIDSEKFRVCWARWKEYRETTHKKNYRALFSEQAALKMLSGMSEDQACDTIQMAIASKWANLYPEKFRSNGNGHSKTGNGGAGVTEQGTRDRLASYTND